MLPALICLSDELITSALERSMTWSAVLTWGYVVYLCNAKDKVKSIVSRVLLTHKS